jgi:hypothetical protein
MDGLEGFVFLGKCPDKKVLVQENDSFSLNVKLNDSVVDEMKKARVTRTLPNRSKPMEQKLPDSWEDDDDDDDDDGRAGTDDGSAGRSEAAALDVVDADESAACWEDHADDDAVIALRGSRNSSGGTGGAVEPVVVQECAQCGTMKDIVLDKVDPDAAPGDLFCKDCWTAFDKSMLEDTPLILINLSKIEQQQVAAEEASKVKGARDIDSTSSSLFTQKLKDERAAELAAKVQRNLTNRFVTDLFDATTMGGGLAGGGGSGGGMCYHTNMRTWEEDLACLEME